jgi:hypothetical protein
MCKTPVRSGLSLAASLIAGAGLFLLLFQTALASQPCEPPNVIAQAVCDMETFHGDPPRQIPDGWTEFILSGNPTYRPGGHTLWGDPSLRIDSNGIPFTAGILTQVPVQRGAGYRASISWGAPNKPNETGRQLGIDPAGGTDPLSPGVIWGPIHFGDGRILNYPLPDVNIDIKARATADTLTVFFRVEHPTATADSLIYIDAIALYPDESAPDEIAEEDVTPPELVDLNIEPRFVDTSAGPVILTVNAQFRDDQSGFDSASLTFQPLLGSSAEEIQVWLDQGHRIDGTLNLPLYRNAVTLPASTTAGRWVAADVIMTDAAGNRVHYERVTSATQIPPPLPLPSYYFINGQDDARKTFLPLLLLGRP